MEVLRPGERLVGASIVPLPFGSGYEPVCPPPITASASFNCAAPFRERLFANPTPEPLLFTLLQLCRSLSGAVMCAICAVAGGTQPALQLCRSLSGAVMRKGQAAAGNCIIGFNCAAPFRERLFDQRMRRVGIVALASIVPLPFGSGYKTRPGGNSATNWMLQLCRSLSGAVMDSKGRLSVTDQSFNCAAPFRERLCASGGTRAVPRCRLQLCRSLSGAVIVRCSSWLVAASKLQLCRSLSGAVISFWSSGANSSARLQLCRSLSGAVMHTRTGGTGRRRAGFNCAAPFRERLSDLGRM